MNNKKIILVIAAFFIGLLQPFAQTTPAFPGAEGYGKYVTGGRGGRVIYVKHILDNTDKFGYGYSGSLRAALETSGSDPITIVFKCGGIIQLKGALNCTRSNITIAGQTALGDGICVTGYGINFSGQNIIVRHMRFRVGDRINQNNPCLTFSNGKKAIFDHCSFSWSVEENVNITDVDSVTLQWCINTESLYYSTHAKGSRAYAAQWGGEHASYHHNLLAHHNSRMPRQNGNTSNDYQLIWDYRNNVHYNWGNSEAFYGGGIEQLGGFCHSNLINNYFKPGPATTSSKSSQYYCAPSGGRPAVVGEGNEYLYGYGLWYLFGNVMHDNLEKTENNWLGLSGSSNHYASDSFAVAPVSTTSAQTAFEQVLALAGATKPKRDTFDRRIVEEVLAGNAHLGGILGATSGIIDSHTEYMPVPSTDPATILEWEKTLYTEVKYTSPLVPVDTDTDGIPDWWESANGLQPTDTSDGKQLALNGSGYTNLETYLNSEDVGRLGPTALYGKKTSPALEVYPNPVHTSIYFTSLLIPAKVEIFNSMGISVLKQEITLQSDINVSKLVAGRYIIKVTFINGDYAIRSLLKI
ncbi:MAG: T9SS type A sorting domain-containing protein [Bacteroidales bacterium]|nr:T9SS type A sorting domain-containing protein [Bacteroidales bacterium]